MAPPWGVLLVSDTPGYQTLTVVRPGEITGEDDYGKPIYGDPVLIDITGCSIQPVLRNPSMELLASTQDTITTRWRFFTPPGADVKASDRVRCNISTADLMVDGDPVLWPDEDGDIDHIEGYLTRFSG